MIMEGISDNIIIYGIAKFLDAESVENMFITNRKFYKAIIEKEHTSHLIDTLLERVKREYSNGSVWKHEIYKGVDEEGVWKVWAEDGKILTEHFYKNGSIEKHRSYTYLYGETLIKEIVAGEESETDSDLDDY